MKANCANPKCQRLSASAATHPEGLCIGCAYLGRVTLNKILRRVNAPVVTTTGRKGERRKQGFRR